MSREMSCLHDKRTHHLMYREELKKDGEKKLLCWQCGQPIWASLHNCVECGNRPVHNYTSSNNHCLEFTQKLENEVVCHGCNEPVLGPAYKCSVSNCGFVIHTLCTELPDKINHPLHPDHTLSLHWLTGKSCDACRRSHDTSFFYYCHLCDLQLDIKCANRFPTNPNECHQHEFLSVWKQVKFNCETCGEQIKNIANLCSICKLLVHKTCAEIPRTVKIQLHNHSLNLTYSHHEISKHDYMSCEICNDKVNTEYATYSCLVCTYVVHLKCLKLFRDKDSAPNKFIGRATHLVKALDQAEDKGPHLGEIQHFSHLQHKLILCDDEIKDDKLCQGCTELIISVSFYSCAQCNFFLHTQCTKLPTKIEQHRLHYFHTLTLLPQAPTKSGVFWCNICYRHQRGFTYKCDECWRQLDVQCGTIPETLKHEGHQHPFYLALDSKNKKCKACPKDNERHVFVCTSCDFILGIGCANLPLVARHKYDTHLLKLTYATEDDCREYYCLICEEERDQNHWFYYCEKCDFPAHTKCVLGNYPRITIGSTYKSEYHEHPLTFVKKPRYGRRCGACWEYFDGVALECSECKFEVHPPRPYYPDCMWMLSEGIHR